MSYKKDTEIKDEAKIKELLQELPSFVTDYIISIESSTTVKTRLEYAKDIKNFFKYIKKELNTDTISASILGSLDQRFYEKYIHDLRYYVVDGKEYTNTDTSLKRKLSALTGFMTYLYGIGEINQNAITKVKQPKLRHKEVIRMDEEETEHFLNTVESGGTLTPQQQRYHNIQCTRDLAICYLILSTGIRVSECVGLDIKDVNFKDSSLHIIRKGGKEAYVYFSDEASAYLMEYYEERKRMQTKEGHEQALFLSSRKQRITDRSIENIVRKYAIRAVPSKHITVHKLRSTYASTLYEHTGDLYLVADNLGHNNIQTSQRYAEVTNKRKSEHRNVITLNSSNISDEKND